MRNGFFEEEDLKTPGGIMRIIIVLAIAVCIFLNSCTTTKKIDSATVTATLNGSKSYDEDGYIAKWFWRQVTTGNSVFITYPQKSITPVTIKKKGRYLFELTVTDNHGATNKDTCKITY